jgi:hypothetical protein
VGLVVHGSRDHSDYAAKEREKNILGGVTKKIKRWFNDFF